MPRHTTRAQTLAAIAAMQVRRREAAIARVRRQITASGAAHHDLLALLDATTHPAMHALALRRLGDLERARALLHRDLALLKSQLLRCQKRHARLTEMAAVEASVARDVALREALDEWLSVTRCADIVAGSDG